MHEVCALQLFYFMESFESLVIFVVVFLLLVSLLGVKLDFCTVLQAPYILCQRFVFYN